MNNHEPLTVGALKKLLEHYPDATPIAYVEKSEFTQMHADDVALLPMYNNGGYVSRAYRPKDEALVTNWLVFPGY